MEKHTQGVIKKQVHLLGGWFCMGPAPAVLSQASGGSIWMDCGHQTGGLVLQMHVQDPGDRRFLLPKPQTRQSLPSCSPCGPHGSPSPWFLSCFCLPGEPSPFFFFPLQNVPRAPAHASPCLRSALPSAGQVQGLLFPDLKPQGRLVGHR